MSIARVVRGAAGATTADLLAIAGLAGDLEHRCSHCGSTDHGRPTLAGGPHLSVSRAPGLSLLALSCEAPVGVDLEPVTHVAPADVTLHPREEAAGPLDVLRAWVRKEAVLKAAGVGLRTDPRSVRIVEGALEGWASSTSYTVEGPPAVIEDLTIYGYLAAVALLLAPEGHRAG